MDVAGAALTTTLPSRPFKTLPDLIPKPPSSPSSIFRCTNPDHGHSTLPSVLTSPSCLALSCAAAATNCRRRLLGTRCSALGDEGVLQERLDYRHERVVHPRPVEIPWKKELANAVHLIGIVAAPVQIKHLSSGKALAWTRLAVRRSATETTWINLTLWDVLAHTAFQHVEKGQQIYVSGRLVSDSVEGDGEKPLVYYKVVVQQLNFIEKNIPPVPLYEPDNALPTLRGVKAEKHAGNLGRSPEELWQAFFSNPTEWWDNRTNKKNPRSPDFKHKHSGEALWIEGRYNPPWVTSQLANLDSEPNSLRANNVHPSSSFIYGDEMTKF